MPISANKRCWAEVDLTALERNLGRIRSAIPPNILYITVVKADAYGHGLPKVVPHLMANFIDVFAVANVQEAITIREIGSGWPILVLSPVLPEEDPLLIEYDLMPTISHPDELERFKQLEHPIKAHLKVDTGMGRSGVWHKEALYLYNNVIRSENVQLAGIYTHFSSAGVDEVCTKEQRSRFHSLLSQIDTTDLVIHLDNSAGIESMDIAGGVNAVRIGLLQYGVLPAKDSELKSLGTEPVLSLYSRVGLTKVLPKGASISYGGTLKLLRDSRIAIVTAGYGDGVPMGLSNQGYVLIHGQRFPILGRVTMDQVIIDITDASNPIRVGDTVTLIGQDGTESLSITDWSTWANTIEWDVYCSITKRVPRNYLNAIVA